MIKVTGISKSYGSKKILNGISFAVGPGTLNAVVGENGAGKSTLMKIIIGELFADEGTIEVAGKKGYCPQQPLIFSMLTVKENFEYFAAAYGLLKTDWLTRRSELMEQLQFTPYLHYKVANLSGGTQQKLNLAIALLNEPAILILDEPYGGFDLQTYYHFREMMMQLKARDKCILLVTHMLNEMADFDNVFTLKQGHIQ